MIAAAGIGLLLLPRLPGIGDQVNGAYLGVKLGPISFQPAEFAKIAIVVFLASYLRDTRQLLVIGARRFAGLTIPPLKHLGPLLVVWGAAMLMLFVIRDIGSSLMFFGGFLALIYVATNRLSFPLIGLLLFAAGRVAPLPDRGPRPEPRRRLAAPVRHRPLRARRRQLPDRAVALRAGRRRRVRPGLRPGAADDHRPDGEPVALLPAAHTDLIYAVITNELGLLGAGAVICVYLLVVERGFKIAMLARDSFSKLLATGLTAVFALQVFVIVGGVTRVIPLTGVTLPVHLLRRLVDPGQLRAAGAAAARLRPRAAGVRPVNAPITRLFVRRRAALRRAGRVHLALDGLRRRGAARQPEEPARAAGRAQIHRGLIRAADGTVLARSVPQRRTRRSRRTLPRRAGCSPTRSATRSRASAAPGLERSRNDELTGERGELGSIVDELARHASARATTSHDARPGRAAGGARRRWAGARARSWRSTRAPAR